MAVCDTCAVDCVASTPDSRGVKLSDLFNCCLNAAYEVARYREAVIAGYKSWRDPAAVCADIFAEYFWKADVLRTSPVDIRLGLLRVGGRLPLAHSTDSEYTAESPFLLMAVQRSAVGSQATKVAREPWGPIRLGCAAHMKLEHLLGAEVSSMGRALAYFRKVAKEVDVAMARALHHESEYICDDGRISFAPNLPTVRE